MEFSEYAAQDAVGLAALVSSRQVSAQELLDAAQARLEAVNPRINAVVIPMHEQARERARQPLRGALAGVPFLIKDISQDYAGVPTTAGSRALRGQVPDTHAVYTQRALDAGLVIFGKTNTPELALKGTTEPEYWGPSRNPWNLAHTTGGSSGGSAATVAAGVVPMAGANDGGGSIRIPAACCGLFGLRPSRGRISQGPQTGEVWEGASSEGVVTRSVRDSAAMLDLLQGPSAGDPFIIRPSERPYAEEVGRDPGRLRIAFCTRSPIGTPVDAECVAAIQDTARLLASLGHHVEEAEPEIDGMALARSYLALYFGHVAVDYARALAQGARAADFELDTRALAAIGRALPAADYVAAHRRWNEFARALGRFFGRFDLYLTPTLACPPVRIGSQGLPALQRLVLKPLLALDLGGLLLKGGQVEQMARDSLAKVPFTQLANLTGTPAMSVPLHWSAGELPLGSHFIAPFGEEARLLRLAAQLEQARPWSGRRPPL
jgi:amidase